MNTDPPLWKPSADTVADANLTAFIKFVVDKKIAPVDDYDSLYCWSIQQREEFWEAVWDFCEVIGDKGASPYLIDGDKMPGAKFFPKAKLNFAENLLRRRDDCDAIVFWGEDKIKSRMSNRQLYDAVSRLSCALQAAGVRAGDRVAGILPNMPGAVVAALAVASLGAVWSSCSPDFGVQGILDRFAQIEPVVVISVDGYWYHGKAHDIRIKIADVVKRLPSVVKTVVYPYLSAQADISDIPHGQWHDDFVIDFESTEIEFVYRSFNDPLTILFSSGTTGVPKCIVHGIGGTLLQHLKEHRLHCNVKEDDRMFYFTTCGWMMWNWLISGLASKATLLLYDGSPFYPSENILFDLADAEKMTFFGTSAKYIHALRKAEADPKSTHVLQSVRTLASTGSPLAPEGFDYVYQHVKSDLCLSSIAGGTDIVSCFVLGNPIGPVWRGEIQKRGLGMNVQVFDPNGTSLVGEKGELVCLSAFPSMPIGFWNDEGSSYHNAYFEVFPNTWRHGDYVELTAHGGMIIYGRSDAVLNPGGVRIGTAEIYRQVEVLEQVLESLVVGQQWENDVRVVLFVVLQSGLVLTQELRSAIKQQIRSGATPRHVPDKICQVPDIPRTKSGKIVELAVRDIIHGKPIKNVEALANPEALAYYQDHPDLKTQG